MSYLKKMVENAEESHGFAGRRAKYYEKLEKKRRKDDDQEDKETEPYNPLIIITLAGVGAFLFWFYWKRY
ncbi:hypothetical protein AKJ54_01090 [candidate division MSBL1 archaeon SCGC-AAA382K21]|uniref:Uncharacterized protein n=1 Tax=candidate division MSBL1 archaeon SCGC-AAA382K21 TaxID=1698283 RepID=A0A133VK32_9EURY|nr:hypothetical protein AKJ54_01090 [candidate division MSBL1 archaeon SCGC-AAA382K21]